MSEEKCKNLSLSSIFTYFPVSLTRNHHEFFFDLRQSTYCDDYNRGLSLSSSNSKNSSPKASLKQKISKKS